MCKIILIGDSTIDNQVWVNGGETVTDQLKKLRPEADIVNLAIDGFTTNNILHGGFKDKAVKSKFHTHTYFKPINQLSQHGNATHVILSVGGNDFREKLQQLIDLPPELRLNKIDAIINGTAANYIEIIKQIKEKLPKAKMSIMLQYTPCVEKDIYFIYYLMLLIAKNQAPPARSLSTSFKLGSHLLFGMSDADNTCAVGLLHDMMAKIYAWVFPVLIKHNVNVIDLASSFDYNDQCLYKSQIEPSLEGSKLIARLISDSIDSPSSDGVLLARCGNNKNSKTATFGLEKCALNWRPGSIWSLSTKESLSTQSPQHH